MNNKLNNKDMKAIIKRIAKDVLLTNDRLRLHLYEEGRDYTWVLNEYQQAVWMLVYRELGKAFTHADVIQPRDRKQEGETKHDVFHSMKQVRLVIGSLANSLPLERLPKRDRISFTSPPELVGKYSPRISKRCDLVLPAEALVTAQNQTNIAWAISEQLVDICKTRRATLDTFEEMEAYLPYRLMEEWDVVGSTVFYILWNIFDWRLRCYANSRGTLAPMYDKVSRSCIRFAEFVKLKDSNFDYWAKWLQQEYKFTMDVDVWAGDIIADPQAFLATGGSTVAVSNSIDWIDARRTNKTNGFIMPDVNASGLGILKAKNSRSRTTLSDGEVNTDVDRFVNINHPKYVHPDVKLAEQLQQDDIYNLRGVDVAEVIPIAKATRNPNQYGGGATAVAASIMDMQKDDSGEWILGTEIQRTPKVPAVLSDMVAGLTSTQEICDVVTRQSKVYAKSCRNLYKFISVENKSAQKQYQAGFAVNGLPSPTKNLMGYVAQPTPFRVLKTTRPLDIINCHWHDEEGKRHSNRYPAFKLQWNAIGTDALANGIHNDDATIMILTENGLSLRGIRSAWVHDAVVICPTQAQAAIDEYTSKWCAVTGVTLDKGASVMS